MGGELAVLAGEDVAFHVTVEAVAAGRIEVIRDGMTVSGPPDPSLTDRRRSREFSLIADDARHWVRVNVRDPSGRLILIGNPIYLKPAA